jgi:hypothetical protein
MILTSNPDATVTFTVANYMSVTQGQMSTSAGTPDVTTALQDTSGRVTRNSNGSFTVSGSSPTGNVLVLQFEVLPYGSYSIVDLIIKNISNINEGGVAWDSIIIGSGANDNKVTLRDIARKPSTATSIDYEIYLLIRPKADMTWFPIGDYGLIDPLWTNN